MTSNWDSMWEIFHAAVELPADGRAAFLDEACGGDADLRREVEELLASHERDDGLPDPTAFAAEFAIDDELATASAGETIGAYRIIREIGQGGMGAVYEAEQAQLNRSVAIKLIRLGMDTRQVVARFEAERQALAVMNHPNIAQVIDAGATESGRPYFVMEYIDGEPITQYCDTHKLDTAARLELFLAVCAGVQHAHQKGVIHRDIKPGNVLIAEESGKPVPKIIDFGIAKATAQRSLEKSLFTQVGMLIGTPEYMSPEQAGLAEGDIDARTDVYSLGVLLFELLVGATPFGPNELRRAGYDEIRRKIREDEPSMPSARLSTLNVDSGEFARRRGTDTQSLQRALRGELDWITMRALEKDRERRYTTANEFAADIKRYFTDEPVLAGPPSTGYRINKFVRRHKILVVASSAVVVALITGTIAASYGFLRAQRAEQVALAEARTSEEVSSFLVDLFRVSQPSAVDANSILARDVLDRGVERIREELGDEPLVQSRLMHEMGVVYAQLGLLEESRQLLEETLEIRRSFPDPVQLDIAETMSALAGIYHLSARHEDAVYLYEDVLASVDSTQDAIDPLWLATVHRSLGGVYDSAGRFNDALTTLAAARTMLQQAGQTNTAEYARVVRNIGISHWSKGDFAAAKAAYDESLSVYERVLEDTHPEVSYVINSLAILNYNLGDLEAARPMFERELANLERTLGREHQHTASIMNNLGLLLLDMGLLDEAKPVIEESLAIRERLLDPEHEDIATSLLNRGKLHLATNNPQQAVEDLSRCLAIREATLGPDHPYVAGTLEWYSKALSASGLDDLAREMEERALSIRNANN